MSARCADMQAGSHCDFETITLLFARGAGLEVCPGREASSKFGHGDEWTECPAIPGAIPGELLSAYHADC